MNAKETFVSSRLTAGLGWHCEIALKGSLLHFVEFEPPPAKFLKPLKLNIEATAGKFSEPITL